VLGFSAVAVQAIIKGAIATEIKPSFENVDNFIIRL
jgi:hypothetical protein